jgi:predicted Zn-dependent peptidase
LIEIARFTAITPYNTTMKKILILATLLSTSVFGQGVQLPPRSRHTLENGLTVILMEYRRVPVVYFRLVARGGSADDPEGFEGLASVACALMREGTTTHTSTEIAQAIDNIGGLLSVEAGLEYCVVKEEILKKDIDTGLSILSEVVLHATFPPEELERQRKLYLSNLESLKEYPERLASVSFSRNLYPNHPYGKQSFGTRASLESMDRDHVIEFYRRVFVPDSSVLAVVGDFNSTELLAKIEQAFGQWEKGEKVGGALPPPEKLLGRKVVIVDKPDATQTQIVCGNIGINIKHPDFFSVKVANTIFGGGFTSRLINSLRVKQSLTYDASSTFSAHLSGGTYMISTFTKNETVGEMMDGLLEELKLFRDRGATVEEWKKAQSYITGNFARGLQTPEALASRITDIEFYGLPHDYIEKYIQNVKSVSLADVNRSAQTHFSLEDLLIVLVTPAQQMRGVAEKYGPVTVVELKDAIP